MERYKIITREEAMSCNVSPVVKVKLKALPKKTQCVVTRNILHNDQSIRAFVMIDEDESVVEIDISIKKFNQLQSVEMDDNE